MFGTNPAERFLTLLLVACTGCAILGSQPSVAGIMHLEDSRFQLYREVQAFLIGDDTTAK